ncbi:AAA family ATPase [bacterium]|nr:AAA family ATPase [bacterium]
MNQELLDKLVTLAAKDPDFYQQRSGDDVALDRFHELFPLESLPDLTLEQYCLGHNCKDENFSWWLERGLVKAIGRYSPGTSKGHLIYLQRGGGYYMHRFIADLGEEGAMEIVRKTLYANASCQSLQEARVLDDPAAFAKRAGISPDHLVGGPARRLRILSMYHPEWMVPINSADHLTHFLTQFSDEDEPELPKKPIELVIQLNEIRNKVHEITGIDVSPSGFSNLLYSPDLNITPPKRDGFTKPDAGPDEVRDEETDVPLPKNLILYGPPGTGKTYSTIDRALEIIDPEIILSTKGEKESRSKRKARFDDLLQTGRIGFVTFHQSFSYEDFVEGLKATTEDGQIKYEVEDGIFKQMCSTAAATSTKGSNRADAREEIDPATRAVWKMSLGNTNGPDAAIFDECIENGYILLGYGWETDFTGVSTREGIRERVQADYPEVTKKDYVITACNTFVNSMKPGDLIIISDGNRKFRAIGIVKGDYRYLPMDDERELLYQQCRDVEWIRTFSPSLPFDQLMTVTFSQASIYRLKPPAFNLNRLRALINDVSRTTEDKPRPFVLIVDEINRGNISRIFGELITLIETSKRAGEPEELSVRLPYSKDMFSVPSNLFLIGTMNTADRSLAQVDIALRRRFVFTELMPDVALLAKLPEIDGIRIDAMLTAMNRRIEVLYDREHAIGHTFFLSLKGDPSLAELERIFSGSILPLLEEYFFEDWERIRLVLGDYQKPQDLAMITPKYSPRQLEELFGRDSDHPLNPAYQRNDNALGNPESYIGIYDPSIFVNAGSLQEESS